MFTGAAGMLARRRDRAMAIWMVFGALLGPVALWLLWIAPRGLCGTCRASVRGWSTICEWCGSALTTARPVAVSIGGESGPVPVAAVPGRRVGVVARGRVSREATAPLAADGIAAADIRRTIENTSDARIRERLTSLSSRRAANAAAAGSGRADLSGDGGPRHVLATGVYVTGTVPLVGGSRYALEVGGATLRVLGPTDIDPTAVALTQVLTGMEATGFDERLVLTFGGGGRHGMVLVFSDLDGSSAAGVSAAILTAARATRVAS